MLDARAESRQRGGTARVKAGHNVVVVGGVARHGIDVRQLQQTLGIDGGFQRLADDARRVVEAEEGIPQAVLRAAQIPADAGRSEAVAALFDKVLTARNVAARRGDAAAGVLDEAARHDVRAEGDGLGGLGELAVAVVHENHRVRVGFAGGVRDLLNRGKVKRIALGVAAAALDVYHRGGPGLLGDQVIVGGEVRQQRALIVVHAKLPQRAAALARVSDADDAFQRVIRAARGGQQGVAGAQQTEQRDGQRVGAAHELRAHQCGLGPHAAGKDLLQLVAAVVPDAVAAGPPEMPCLDAAVGEGTQHFELVVVADLLHMGKLRTAEVEGLAVQRQHFGAQVVKLFDHVVFQSVV